MHIVSRNEDIVKHFQNIDSRIVGINTYDNGKCIVDVEKGFYIYPHIHMLSMDELRDLYRSMRSGESKVIACNRRITLPGRNGPIGAPTFLAGTW